MKKSPGSIVSLTVASFAFLVIGVHFVDAVPLFTPEPVAKGECQADIKKGRTKTTDISCGQKTGGIKCNNTCLGNSQHTNKMRLDAMATCTKNNSCTNGTRGACDDIDKCLKCFREQLKKLSGTPDICECR